MANLEDDSCSFSLSCVILLLSPNPMKIIRYGAPGEEKPGVMLRDGTRIDVSGFGSDFDEKFFAGDCLKVLETWLCHHASSAPRGPGTVRLGPPICRPSKIVCIGLNFRDHAAESGMDIPREPVLFFKSTSSLAGPNDNLIIPRGAAKVDWEVELALVIRGRASYVGGDTAARYIAGYVLHNDYSERAFQLERGGQWVKGKSADSFAPLGPFMATPDEVHDVHDLRLWLKVNGETRQSSSTRELVFGVPALVSNISQF